jgi:hypothetical protein
MSKVDPMHAFAIDEARPRFSRRDLIVAALIIGIAAAFVAIPLLADVRGLAAELNIAAGPPYP